MFGRQQWGFCWDAFFADQDMQAAKGMWIGMKNFTDPVNGIVYTHKIVHNGPRAVPDVEIREYMPQEIKLVARYAHPEVFVDESEASDMMNGANAKNAKNDFFISIILQWERFEIQNNYQKFSSLIVV